MTGRPEPGEYAPYHAGYVALATEDDLPAALRAELPRTLDLLRDVPDADASVLHPPYTWTIKQVISHMSDAERVFGYRALCFARGDRTPLPSFDESSYAETSESDARPLPSLVDEFAAARLSNLATFANLPPASWTRLGIANSAEISVRALAAIMLGHERHHAAILRKRLGREG